MKLINPIQDHFDEDRLYLVVSTIFLILARNSVSNDAAASGRGINVEIPTPHIRSHNTQ
jgi:hypothetical protein